MLKNLLNELEQCLIEAKNPILPYLEGGTPFDPDDFANRLHSLELDVCEDLNILYTWKPGLKKEFVNNPYFKFQTFVLGSHMDYAEALRNYQLEREKGTFESRFFPILLPPGFDPRSATFIDLSKRSDTFGKIYYDDPTREVTGFHPIFNSISEMIETFLIHYKYNLFTINEEGILT